MNNYEKTSVSQKVISLKNEVKMFKTNFQRLAI